MRNIRNITILICELQLFKDTCNCASNKILFVNLVIFTNTKLMHRHIYFFLYFHLIFMISTILSPEQIFHCNDDYCNMLQQTSIFFNQSKLKIVNLKKKIILLCKITVHRRLAHMTTDRFY